MPSFQKHELDELTAAIDALIASIFNTVEYPALTNNPNVTNVITGGH